MKNGVMKKLFNLLDKDKKKLVLAIFCSVIMAVCTAVGPKVLGMVTTTLADGVLKSAGTISIDTNRFYTLLLAAAIIYIGSFVFGQLSSLIVLNVSQSLVLNLRKKMAEKINHIPMNYFESRPIGDVLSVITNDIDIIGSSISNLFSKMASTVTIVLGITAMMLWINPLMALVVIITVPIEFYFSKIVLNKCKKHFVKQQMLLGAINGQVEEEFSAFEVIKSYGKEQECIEKYNELNEKLSDASMKAQFMSSIMGPIVNSFSKLGTVGVLILGGYMAMTGKIAIGDIQAFVTYANNFYQPIKELGQTAVTYQSMVAAADRIFDFLELEEEDVLSEDDSIEAVSGEVSFNNVSFGYNKDQIIINDFSLDVRKGQKIAIVGPTGAGKSTLIKLLMRFYDTNSGDITLDGHKISKLNRSSVRSSVGMVLQESWLFKGSIMDNIRLGNLNATDEEVIMAAKMADADFFISNLPGGYDFVLSDNGLNLSAGQRQLLTLARAILADRPLLILDEATSSVDTRTEKSIQTAMDKLMAGRTSFVIAHRLSTIINADKILVLKDGDIIEQGNHEELMQKQGFYYSLYMAQYA